jgi:hypothetical protein
MRATFCQSKNSFPFLCVRQQNLSTLLRARDMTVVKVIYFLVISSLTTSHICINGIVKNAFYLGDYDFYDHLSRCDFWHLKKITGIYEGTGFIGLKNQSSGKKVAILFVDIRNVHEKWSIFCFYDNIWIVVVLEKIAFEILNSCTCFRCNTQTFLNFCGKIDFCTDF